MIENVTTIPREFLEQAAQFRDPVVIINTHCPGVLIPPALQALAANDGGKLVMPLSGDVAENLVFDEQLQWFELTGIDGPVRIPGAAILMIMDRKTGEALSMNRTMLKDSN